MELTLLHLTIAPDTINAMAAALRELAGVLHALADAIRAPAELLHAVDALLRHWRH